MTEMKRIVIQFSSVHSVVSNSLRPHELQHDRVPSPSTTPGACSNSCPSSQWPCSHLILCRPLLLLPSIFPSIRLFSNEFALCMTWPKYWSFGISPSNDYSSMAPHSSTLAWKILWMEEPGRLQSTGLLRVGHD